MNELPDDLERALRDLDAQATRRAARVSPERVAARVLARLRQEPAADAPRVLVGGGARRWVGVAAAAVLVVAVGGVTLRLAIRGSEAPVGVPVAVRALDSLDVSGLERVLSVTAEVRSQAAAPVPVAVSGTWEDLTEAQLRAVLQAVQQQSEGGTL